ncbi:MAG: hypothetical protein R2862_09985 [Thermoanaerobaculia bacterium]
MIWPHVWSGAAASLLAESNDPSGKGIVWKGSTAAEGPLVRISAEGSSEWGTTATRDGRWVAYTSDATRRLEVYVRRFDGAGVPLRVSIDGGTAPAWRRDGRELYFVDDAGRLLAVLVRTVGSAPCRHAPSCSSTADSRSRPTGSTT